MKVDTACALMQSSRLAASWILRGLTSLWCVARTQLTCVDMQISLQNASSAGMHQTCLKRASPAAAADKFWNSGMLENGSWLGSGGCRHCTPAWLVQ